MLEGGITSAVLLDELECHLRDDVEAQIESGSDALRAFEIAARSMGPATALKTEFQKTKSYELMKSKIKPVLVIILLMAAGAALIVPYIAQWRAHGALAPADLFPFLFGVAFFACGAVLAGRFVVENLKNRPEA